METLFFVSSRSLGKFIKNGKKMELIILVSFSGLAVAYWAIRVSFGARHQRNALDRRRAPTL